jgi:excisionase family DNA binding protein
MNRGTLREATRVGQASKVKGAFFVEFKKAEPAVPQDAGKTPSACPIQRNPRCASPHKDECGSRRLSDGDSPADEGYAESGDPPSILQWLRDGSEPILRMSERYQSREVPIMLPTGKQSETSVTQPFEKLLNLQEASSILGLHWKTLEGMARKGKVPAFKVGKRWRFRLTSLNAWLEHGLNSTTTDYAVLTEEEQHP